MMVEEHSAMISGAPASGSDHAKPSGKFNAVVNAPSELPI